MFAPLSTDRRIERPGYAWLAIALELFTAFGAIPVGLMLLSDPSGRRRLPGGLDRGHAFGSYLSRASTCS